MPYRSGTKSFDDVLFMQEGIRQTAVAGATQSQARQAEILYHRVLYQTALLYNVSPSVYVQALHSLGVRS
jgi:hypothetical protein